MSDIESGKPVFLEVHILVVHKEPLRTSALLSRMDGGSLPDKHLLVLIKHQQTA